MTIQDNKRHGGKIYCIIIVILFLAILTTAILTDNAYKRGFRDGRYDTTPNFQMQNCFILGQLVEQIKGSQGAESLTIKVKNRCGVK